MKKRFPEAQPLRALLEGHYIGTVELWLASLGKPKNAWRKLLPLKFSENSPDVRMNDGVEARAMFPAIDDERGLKIGDEPDREAEAFQIGRIAAIAHAAKNTHDLKEAFSLGWSLYAALEKKQFPIKRRLRSEEEGRVHGNKRKNFPSGFKRLISGIVDALISKSIEVNHLEVSKCLKALMDPPENPKTLAPGFILELAKREKVTVESIEQDGSVIYFLNGKRGEIFYDTFRKYVSGYNAKGRKTHSR